MKDQSTNLKPQDVVILFKLLVYGDRHWTQSELSQQLSISQSEISESIKRSKYSGLINSFDGKVNKRAFFDFIVYGLKYVFPQRPGPIVRGVLTAHSAPFFQSAFMSDEPFVWPDPKGQHRGQAISPLYPTVTESIKDDDKLYLYLALVDIFRVGRAREKELAIELLEKQIEHA